MAPLILNAAIAQVDFGLAAEHETDELEINLETYFESSTIFISIYIAKVATSTFFPQASCILRENGLWPILQCHTILALLSLTFSLTKQI